MRRISVKVLTLLSVLAFARGSEGDEPALEIPPSLILERFAVSKNSDFLLVPVNVRTKDFLFIVDTGADVTLFDTSHPLGEPIGVVTADGAEGEVAINLYRTPDAKLGRTSLGSLDVVAGTDLKYIRQVSGLPIQGILGMDFLGKYVVHVNVVKGELLLLRSVPKSAGVEMPISWEPGVRPSVVAEIVPGEQIRFTVDTGSSSLGSGSLGVFQVTSLVKSGQVREIGKTFGWSLTGSNSHRLFQGSALNIGGFAVHSPIFHESYGAMPNRLGLAFWPRFVVTFDFPERKVYLRESSYFDRPDRWNATGLHLWKRSDSIEVFAVDPDSPASRAGLKKGDVLVELDGLVASKTSLFELRNALCDGSQLTCVIRRDSQERRMSINQVK